jgi:2-polyprenyl-3-methyl-5-hydroxy-6-metoxy-1,4-benzoquinol methylase
VTVIDRFIQRLRIKQVEPFIKPSDKVLDIGTADGALFSVLSYLKNGTGIDPQAERRPLKNATLIRGFFPHALPDNQQFDVITMLAVLEHIPLESQRQMARDCFSRLGPSGRLIITVPSPRVDDILKVMKAARLIHGMSLEQHYGYDITQTPDLFCSAGFKLLKASKFQFGLNNLFVFEKVASKAAQTSN